MFIVLGFIINGLIIALLLIMIGKQDVMSDIMRPIAIAIFSAIASIIPSILLSGTFGSIVSFATYMAAMYFFLGFFYVLTDDIRRKIIGIFVAINVIWSVSIAAISSAMT